MNTVQQLNKLGQSIWYDNISRSMITGGELQARVDEGLTGVTSNPTIFDKAISGSSDYDDQIRELVEQNPAMGAVEIIQALMVKDIQMATDVLMPVYRRTNGADGFISVEVNPTKAHDTAATIDEVRLLWKRINRSNLMVKIPATKEGLPAIEQTTYEGMNINVTLIFSLERYQEVADSYITGIERRVKEGKPVGTIASVASVFVSRVDTLVDDLLNKKIATARDQKEAERFRGLLGQAAVANAKLVYRAFRRIFEGPRFTALRAKGASVQRPLWGSTGTKNPAYSDVKYVDTLIGAHTVNTTPPATYKAILDHTKPVLTIETDLPAAEQKLRDLASAGIDLSWVMQKLEDDGVTAFAKSFNDLYRSLEQKRAQILGSAVPTA